MIYTIITFWYVITVILFTIQTIKHKVGRKITTLLDIIKICCIFIVIFIPAFIYMPIDILLNIIIRASKTTG